MFFISTQPRELEDNYHEIRWGPINYVIVMFHLISFLSTVFFFSKEMPNYFIISIVPTDERAQK